MIKMKLLKINKDDRRDYVQLVVTVVEIDSEKNCIKYVESGKENTVNKMLLNTNYLYSIIGDSK
jgi:hypothetical protein